jgi:type III secretory pathway component EscU
MSIAKAFNPTEPSVAENLIISLGKLVDSIPIVNLLDEVVMAGYHLVSPITWIRRFRKIFNFLAKIVISPLDFLFGKLHDIMADVEEFLMAKVGGIKESAPVAAVGEKVSNLLSTGPIARLLKK